MIAVALLCLPTITSAATRNSDIPTVAELDKASQKLIRNIIKAQGQLLALQRDIKHPPQARWTVFLTRKAESNPDTNKNNNRVLTLKHVSLELDGETIAQQQYSANERRALRYGGADQLFLGSLHNGPHHATITIAGRYQGKAFQRTRKITFHKPSGPRIMWIRIRPRNHSSESAHPGISVKHVNDLP